MLSITYRHFIEDQKKRLGIAVTKAFKFRSLLAITPKIFQALFQKFCEARNRLTFRYQCVLDFA